MADSDEQLSELGDVKSGSVWSVRYAYAYLTGLVATAIGVFVGAWYFDLISIDAAISVSADLGWVVELTVAGLVGLFFLWTFVQIVKVTGSRFMNSLIDTIANIADKYEKER